MFDNIGRKIKDLAGIACWLGIIGSVIDGLIFFAIGRSMGGGGGMVVIGILIAVAGSFLSWIGSFLLYGFGQLVENSDILVEQGNNMHIQGNIDKDNGQTSTPSTVVPSNNSFVWHPVDETSALILGETTIKCVNCHRIQLKGNKVCNQCGAKFITLERKN